MVLRTLLSQLNVEVKTIEKKEKMYLEVSNKNKNTFGAVKQIPKTTVFVRREQ